MGKKLYVGNLSYSIGNSELERLFEAHGAVRSAQSSRIAIPDDPRGSALWKWAATRKRKRLLPPSMAREVEGRALTVNEARPQQSGGGGGYGGGGYGGGKRGGGGGGMAVAAAVVGTNGRSHTSQLEASSSCGPPRPNSAFNRTHRNISGLQNRFLNFGLIVRAGFSPPALFLSNRIPSSEGWLYRLRTSLPRSRRNENGRINNRPFS